MKWQYLANFCTFQKNFSMIGLGQQEEIEEVTLQPEVWWHDSVYHEVHHSANVHIFWSGLTEGAVVLWTSFIALLHIKITQVVEILHQRRHPWQQGSWGQHGANLGPIGPRWAPCWPHEPCYLGLLILQINAVIPAAVVLFWWSDPECASPCMLRNNLFEMHGPECTLLDVIVEEQIMKV